MVIEMNEEMIKNSKIFLDRVTIKGIVEATAYLQIVQAIDNAKKIEKTIVEKKSKNDK
jgi:hypothetical protein